MSDHLAAAGAAAHPRWTCPFCPLACDHLGVRTDGAAAPALQGGECPRASRALASFAGTPSIASPTLNGTPCNLDDAVATAAAWLAASRQPLFGGLGTDVAGARALYRLACATGAICDAAGGAALMTGLRPLQDRGQFTATLAEVRTRADVIVFVGGLPVEIAPLIGQRCGIGDPQVPQRHVVVLGERAGDGATLSAWARLSGVTVESLPLQGDLFDSVAVLAALVAGHLPAALASPLGGLARRLHDARYAVLVGAPALLPPHGALIVEAVNQIVGTLNRGTRAASLWIGGGDGAATVNQVFAWLSGLPLRSRAGARGLEHEPLGFDTARLLADGAVDALLWISSFDADNAPPPNGLPMVVLGHPGLAARCGRSGAPTLFIPVATPGIGEAGHLFRTDGTVLMPLHAVLDSGLPSVASVLAGIERALSGEAP
ncbi:MAG TPA: formylmethanofuran dehydrogenase [Burkholderiaceae bacterium]